LDHTLHSTWIIVIQIAYIAIILKIYDGVDVLKNHLNEDHNIDEYFVDRIEKKLMYLDEKRTMYN